MQKISKTTSIFKDVLNNKKNKYTLIFAVSLIILSALSFYFVSTNEKYYKNTIAKITSVSKGDQNNGTYAQQLKAIIMNGMHKGKEIQLKNIANSSQAYNFNFKVNDAVFVSLYENKNNDIISATIIEIKRDKYIVYIIILFIVLILFIGKAKGFRSLTSVIFNVLTSFAVIKLLLYGFNPILVASVASILFVLISISIVSGVNKKSLAAIIGTLIGTFASILIAVVVVLLTKTKGLGHQDADFLLKLPHGSNFTIEQIFLIGILIGTLGAIMDIAVCISSSIQEICIKNSGISNKELIASGMEIGKDTMGTMANTLLFAYISGSIPLILLLIKNGMSFAGIIGFNISHEIVRALAGSIGIVLSIPITLYVSVILLKNRKIGEM